MGGTVTATRVRRSLFVEAAMMVFLALAAIMALSVAWLLFMPIVGHTDISRRAKQKTIFAILVTTILFPFTVYWLVTF